MNKSIKSKHSSKDNSMFILADIDTKKVYKIDNVVSVLYLIQNLKNHRVHISLESSDYYYSRLLKKEYSSVEARFITNSNKGYSKFYNKLSLFVSKLPNLSALSFSEQFGSLVTTLNDLIFENYAHRHTDVIDYLPATLRETNELIEYGFDSTAGVTYFSVKNPLDLLECLNELAARDIH